MNRRGFIFGLGATIAVVRVAPLMRIVPPKLITELPMTAQEVTLLQLEASFEYQQRFDQLVASLLSSNKLLNSLVFRDED